MECGGSSSQTGDRVMSRNIVAFGFSPSPGCCRCPSPSGAPRRYPGGAGGGFRAPLASQRTSARGILRAGRRLARPARARHPPPGMAPARIAIPPVAAGGTCATARRRSSASRRHHGISPGWNFPVTIGDDAAISACPMIRPKRSRSTRRNRPTRRRPRAAAPWRRGSAHARENRDACRAERVTVRPREGEREIKVVRC